MLPAAAAMHFQHLCTDSFVASGLRLQDAQREFDAKESARGSGRSGSGYAARLSALYVTALERNVFDHAAAQSRLGASIFWVRRTACFPSEDEMVAGWGQRRDGAFRGIIEITKDRP